MYTDRTFVRSPAGKSALRNLIARSSTAPVVVTVSLHRRYTTSPAFPALISVPFVGTTFTAVGLKCTRQVQRRSIYVRVLRFVVVKTELDGIGTLARDPSSCPSAACNLGMGFNDVYFVTCGRTRVRNVRAFRFVVNDNIPGNAGAVAYLDLNFGEGRRFNFFLNISDGPNETL